MKLFNYKDWWCWVLYFFVGVALVEFIKGYENIQMWKWGYWSIDWIIPTVILVILWLTNNYILSERRWKWIKQEFRKQDKKEKEVKG